MFKRRKIIFSITVAAAVIFAVWWFILTHAYLSHGNRIESVSVGGHRFQVEVVSSAEKLEKGLGGRESLCSSCGMLFKFQKAGKYSFWMKDMLIPLDIIWISNNKIVHLEKNVQPDFQGVLPPNENADRVLELSDGSVDKYILKVGDDIVM